MSGPVMETRPNC